MAITTYAELQTAVANWVDHTGLTARIPEFIALAEAEMNRELRLRRMLQRAYLTASAEFIGIPSDWLGVRNVDITNGGIRYPVSYETPEVLDRLHDGTTGLPNKYTILGSEMQLWPAPDTGYRLDISYFKKIPALSDSNTSNWLLSAHPDVYLYGASAEAHKYLKNVQEYKDDMGRFMETMAQIRRVDKRDKYSSGSLRIRAA